MASTAKGGNEKKKDEVFVGDVRIVHQDITKELEGMILNSATTALQAYYGGEISQFEDVACQIKKEMEESMTGAWHVIVGKSFGSFVTHEVKQ